MTRNFHRWEIDPFFSAAEQVQDSADRLESAYRTWLYTKSIALDAEDSSSIEFRSRELSTALGTAKWQLEEFEKAVSSLALDTQQQQQYAEDDTPERHKQFIVAIWNQITSIETSLLCSEDARDLKALPVVSLGQEEKDDLELFLCGSRMCLDEGSFTTDDKMHEETSSSSSRSMHSKIGTSERFSPSTSSSDQALQKARVTKLDASSWPHKLCSLDDPCENGLHGDRKTVMATDLVRIQVDQGDQAISHSDSELLLRDHCNSANVYHRSISIGDDLSYWKDGPSISSSKRRGYRQVASGATLNIWSLFSKMRHTFGLQVSKSGLKRWKDGDANAIEQSQMPNIRDKTSEYEKGSYKTEESCSIFLKGDEKHYKAFTGALQTLQCSQIALPSRRPIRVASAILAAFGLIGLLSFHVTALAF